MCVLWRYSKTDDEESLKLVPYKIRRNYGMRTILSMIRLDIYNFLGVLFIGKRKAMLLFPPTS